MTISRTNYTDADTLGDVLGDGGDLDTDLTAVFGQCNDNEDDIAALDAEVIKDTGNQTVAGVKTFSSEPIISDLTASTAVVSSATKELVSSTVTVTELGYLANASSELQAQIDATVKDTGNQTVAGVKTFSSSPIVPTPTTDMQTSTKKYVDDNTDLVNDTAPTLGGNLDVDSNEIINVDKLGIGRTPYYVLDVLQDSGDAVMRIKAEDDPAYAAITLDSTNTAAYIMFKRNSVEQSRIAGTVNKLAFYTGSAAALAMDINSSQIVTFVNMPVTPSTAPTTDYQVANKKYVDDLRRAYVRLQDERAAGFFGGTFTQGAWQTRTLNRENYDGNSLCTLSSNTIVLTAGTYIVQGSAPAYAVDGHKARLYDTFNSNVLLIGTSEYADATNLVMTRSIISGHITVASDSIIELQHYCDATKTTDGFGIGSSGSGEDEIYSVLEFWRTT